jgi:hypothetical protein
MSSEGSVSSGRCVLDVLVVGADEGEQTTPSDGADERRTCADDRQRVGHLGFTVNALVEVGNEVLAEWLSAYAGRLRVLPGIAA